VNRVCFSAIQMAEKGDVPETEALHLTPSKETYHSIQSDVSPIGAVKELIDNAIDNWERVHGRQSDLEIDITFDPSEDVFEIKDNSGGLEEDQIGKLFALGESTKDEVNTPIGAYGVGAKKAIVKLGRDAELRSRYERQEYGYGFNITEEWIQTPDEWEVDKQPYTELESGTTVISVRDLRSDLDEAGEKLEEINDGGAEGFLGTLRDELSQTYERFLQPSEYFTGNFNIVLNGESVEVPDPIDWSFTPFDGFHPRAYEDITLRRHNLDQDISVTIVVGLMTTADEKEAGTDIFCQNRKVITGNSGTKGGFEKEHTDLGDVGPSRGRLKVQLFFKTTGDADRLPWDTQKNDIDEYDSLMQEVYEEWLSKIVAPYWKAAPYGNYAAPFIQPYGQQGDWTANNGQLDEFDYSGRKLVTDKPNTDHDEKEWLEDKIDIHLDLGISAPHLVEERFRPTYKDIVSNTDLSDEEGPIDEPIVVPDCPHNTGDQELINIVKEVKNTARKDASQGQRRDVSNEWWAPIYSAYLEHFADPESLTVVDSETIDADLGPGETESSTQSSGAHTSSVGESDEGTDTSQSALNAHQDSTTSENSSQNTVSKSNSQNTSQTTTASKVEPTTSGTTSSEDTGEKGESPDEDSQSTGLGSSSRSTQGPEDPKGYALDSPTDKTVALDFEPDEWETLCAYLDVDPDEDIESIEDRLKTAILSDLVNS
jgi:hypothetical protein